MKAPMSVRVAWVAAAGVIFSVGYFVGSFANREAGIVARVGAHLPDASLPAPVRRASDNPEPQGAAPHEPLTAEQVRVRAFQVAAEPMGRVERMRQLCELLPLVTQENWRQVLDGFETAMRTKPGGAGENYTLLLEHVGAVAGREALEDALTPEKVSDKARFIALIKGWAENDSKASVAWYQTQPPAIQDAYMGHFVAGVSRTDPKTALEFTLKQDEAFYRGGTTTAVVNNAVGLLGLRGVEDIFSSMSVRTDIPEGAKGQFFALLVNKRLPLLQSSTSPGPEVLNWFLSHVGHAYVSARESSRIISEAAKADPTAALSWLDRQSSRLPPVQATSGFSAAARELQRQSPQLFSTWLASHPDHPQRDNMIEAATDALIASGDLSGALRMSAAIGSADKRSRVGTVVQRRAAAQQTEPAR